MKTKYLNIKELGSFDKAVQLLLSGEVIAFPTETVYGLGICYDSDQGFKKLCDVKKRNFSKSIAICLDCYKSVTKITQEIPEQFWVLAKEFFPGPLTIVFSSGMQTIGIRVPMHAICQKLIEKTGPLYVTSANYSNESELSDPIMVYNRFKGSISAVLTDDVRLQYQRSSTVIEIKKSGEIQLLRKGPIPWNLIQSKMQHNYNYQT